MPDKDKKSPAHGLKPAQQSVDQKRVAGELARSKRELESKSRFFASMSHEIRIPMNSIMGMTQLLTETSLSKQQKDYLNALEQSSIALMKTIDELLDYSELESGTLKLNAESFCLSECIEEAISVYQLETENKNIALECTIAPGLPKNVLGDRSRYSQILSKLLGSAVKHSGNSTIKVQVSAGSGENLIHTQISDNGMSVLLDDIDQMFSTSETIDNTHDSVPSADIGVVISQQLAELMGGKLHIKSNAGVSNKMWFEVQLPAVKMSSTTSHIPANLEFEGNVLLVEDNHINQKVAQAFLDKVGLTVTTANDGQQALDKAEEEKFDLIIMDCQMPVLDGYEATRCLRSGQQLNRETPIIALTGTVTPESSQDCLSAGMNEVLQKPVRKEELYKTIAHWLDQPYQASVARPPAN